MDASFSVDLQNELKVVLEKWGDEVVTAMLARFQMMGKEHTRTYQHYFHPQLYSDSLKVQWIMEQPPYADKVDKGRQPGELPEANYSELFKWSQRLDLPKQGTYFENNRGLFVERVQYLILERGIPGVDYFNIFSDPNRVNDLEQQIYKTIKEQVHTKLISLTKKFK